MPYNIPRASSSVIQREIKNLHLFKCNKRNEKYTIDFNDRDGKVLFVSHEAARM